MTILLLLRLSGGIGLFLLGLVLLTDGLKAWAGESLRRVLLRFTGTPGRAFLSGFVITALVQSSSATTVALIGFVSAVFAPSPQEQPPVSSLTMTPIWRQPLGPTVSISARRMNPSFKPGVVILNSSFGDSRRTTKHKPRRLSPWRPRISASVPSFPPLPKPVRTPFSVWNG